MTEPFDPYADQRAELEQELKAISDPIVERFRPLIEEADYRNWPKRRARLFADMTAERDAATKDILRKWAALPPPPIIITAEEARAFVKARGW